MLKSTRVVTTTDQLSAIADSLLERAGNPALTKNTILNIIAAGICGSKHNWGFLKASQGTVYGTGLAATPEIAAEESAKPTQRLHEHVSFEWGLGMFITLTTPGPNGRDGYVLLDALDLTLLCEAFFGAKPARYLGLRDVLIEQQGDMLVFHRNQDGAIARMEIPAATFQGFLDSNAERITILLRRQRIYDQVHTAYCVVAEGSTEIAEMEADAADAAGFRLRLDAACHQAALSYVQSAARQQARLEMFRSGAMQQITDDVIDNAWEILLPLVADPSEI